MSTLLTIFLFHAVCSISHLIVSDFMAVMAVMVVMDGMAGMAACRRLD